MGYHLNSFDSTICRQQGRLFVISVQEGYDSHLFVKEFMASEVARRLDLKYTMLHGTGEHYWMEEFIDNRDYPKGSVYSDSFMQWAGHLYRFWHYYTGESSLSIYQQATIDRLARVYLSYHCMDWSVAVDRLKEVDRSRNEIQTLNLDY